ncbi:MAG: IS1595 family transposase [Gemmatimonadetes bacterium]|nr:IS1595 family transposase [Gemmatimonadota bacterium]
MNLVSIIQQFPHQAACINHLESVRWGEQPQCPFCQSEHVARKAEKGRVGRWNCHACKSSFNVLSGTIFEKTRIPLQKWFLAIGLMLNAKKSLSSYQLARDCDLNPPSAWYMQQRIRAAMADNDRLLSGLVEADETYVGGKPRRTNRKDDHTRNKPGRGTKKTPVIGVVERGGAVIAKVAEDLTGKGIVQFLKGAVDPDASLLITDEYRGYNAAESFLPHAVINHSERYVDGWVHTNTIEGFWALIKRAWYGQHHHYSRRYTPLYVAETSWKYNERKNPNTFGTFLRGCF